jgi:hypothetical protein
MDKEADMAVQESLDTAVVLDDRAGRAPAPAPDLRPAPDPDAAGADEPDDSWVVEAA